MQLFKKQKRCDFQQNHSETDPTWWGAQHQRGVWCSAADIWRNPAASLAASRWWGCGPCLSRSPEQQASHACATALWRPAIKIQREKNSNQGWWEAAGQWGLPQAGTKELTLNVIYPWESFAYFAVRKHLDTGSGERMLWLIDVSHEDDEWGRTSRLHSWVWSTAAAELRDGCSNRKASPPVMQMASFSPHVDAQTYATVLT